MKFNPYSLSLAAMFCISLLPSCTSEIEPPPPPQENYSSSSSSLPLSSTVWCLYGGSCISIVSDDCPAIGGQIVQICPMASSSSSIPSSSSSGGSSLPSSSSALQPSSSSSVPSSPLSSSSFSIVPSSSSVIPSSSSVALSSSSLVPSGSKEPPTLVGECKWDKNPTLTARGANPSGVNVVDIDKICKSIFVGYRYTVAGIKKDWPSTGILSEWKDWDKKHKETYEVEAILKCTEYPTEVTSPCPPLEVNIGADYLIECDCTYYGGSSCPDASSCKVGNTRGYSVTLKKDECVEINVIGYENPYYLPTLGMRCSSQGGNGLGEFTLSLNGTAKTHIGASPVFIELKTIKLGDNELGTLCLTAISGVTGVICSGPEH